MASSRNSNQLIQKLLEAEAEAERIVRAARENRIKKIKEAQISAEQETARFKEQEAARFQREVNEKYAGGDKSNELEEKTKIEIDSVKKDYRANRDAVVAFLVQKAIEVSITLDNKEKRQIQMVCARQQGAN